MSNVKLIPSEKELKQEIWAKLRLNYKSGVSSRENLSVCQRQKLILQALIEDIDKEIVSLDGLNEKRFVAVIHSSNVEKFINLFRAEVADGYKDAKRLEISPVATFEDRWNNIHYTSNLAKYERIVSFWNHFRNKYIND